MHAKIHLAFTVQDLKSYNIKYYKYKKISLASTWWQRGSINRKYIIFSSKGTAEIYSKFLDPSNLLKLLSEDESIEQQIMEELSPQLTDFKYQKLSQMTLLRRRKHS